MLGTVIATLVPVPVDLFCDMVDALVTNPRPIYNATSGIIVLK